MTVLVVVRYYVAKIFPAAAGFVSTLFLIRLAQPQVYIDFATISAGILATASLFVGWLNQAQLRSSRFSRPDDSCMPRSSIRDLNDHESFCVSLFLSFASVFLAIIALQLAQPGFASTFVSKVLISFCVGGLVLHMAIIGRFQSTFKTSYFLSAELGRGFASSVFPIVFVLLLSDHIPRDIVLTAGLAAGVLFFSSVSFALSMQSRGIADSNAGIPKASTLSTLRSYWAYGWPLSIWLGLFLSQPFFERLIVGGQCDNPEVIATYIGGYEMFFRVCSLLLMPLTQALHPKIMAAFNAGQDQESRKLILRGILFQGVSGLLLLVFVYITIPSVIPYTGLKADSTGSMFLLVLMFSGVVWQIGLMAQKSLESLNRTGLMTVCLAVSIAVGLLCSFLLAGNCNAVSMATANATGALIYLFLVVSLARWVRSASA